MRKIISPSNSDYQSAFASFNSSFSLWVSTIVFQSLDSYSIHMYTIPLDNPTNITLNDTVFSGSHKDA